MATTIFEDIVFARPTEPKPVKYDNSTYYEHSLENSMLFRGLTIDLLQLVLI